MADLQMEQRTQQGQRAQEQAQQLGEAWIQAVLAGAFQRLGQLSQPDLCSQILTSKRFITLENAGELVAKYQGWFGEARGVQSEQHSTARVGERVAIFYRLRLQEEGLWKTVEQQLYCTLKDGLVARMQLLCSGFQLDADGAQNLNAGASEKRPASALNGASMQPASHALLEMLGGRTQTESTCAILTPAIKAKLREMTSGQVLEVRVNDPDAKGDIEAWCRLTGNPLLHMSEREGQELWFFLQKK